jgi:hypothetical protein
MRQQVRDRGRPGVPEHRHDGDQHQHRAEQRVEEELERRVDAPLAAPHADDDVHRDQAAFEEDVEQHDVERAEDADHQRFQDQEGDHVGLDALLDRFPAGQDRQRHQEGRQDDEQHGDAVDAHVVGDAAVQPVDLLDELETRIGGIEADPDQKRDDEGEPVVSSATMRMLRRAISLSSLMNRMISTPTSGRNVTSERIGIPAIRRCPRASST